MAALVGGSVSLAASFNPDPRSIYDHLIYLLQMLNGILQRIYVRLNIALPEDGSEAMTKPLPLKVYLTAALPTTAIKGSVVYVSDAAAGSRIQAWNGSAWAAGG